MISFHANDVGSPQQKGESKPHETGWKLVAGGEDIWGTSDEFHFASVPVSGDFSLQARVVSLEKVHHYTKAGLMARVGTGPDAAHVFLLTFPDDGARNNNSGKIEAQFRPAAGSGCTALYPSQKGRGAPEFPLSFPHLWLKLGRRGNQWTCEVGSDGKAWTLYCQFALGLPANLEVGLAATSHEGSQPVSVVFDSVTLS